jgi:hypothetical protein
MQGRGCISGNVRCWDGDRERCVVTALYAFVDAAADGPDV